MAGLAVSLLVGTTGAALTLLALPLSVPMPLRHKPHTSAPSSSRYQPPCQLRAMIPGQPLTQGKLLGLDYWYFSKVTTQGSKVSLL